MILSEKSLRKILRKIILLERTDSLETANLHVGHMLNRSDSYGGESGDGSWKKISSVSDYNKEKITVPSDPVVHPAPVWHFINKKGEKDKIDYTKYSKVPNGSITSWPQQKRTDVKTVTDQKTGKTEKRGSGSHKAVDIGTSVGIPILAIADGSVIGSTSDSRSGNYVVIKHTSGFPGARTLYCHLSERKVSTGEKVSKGQVIGLSGATGKITGPHLHFGFAPKGSDYSFKKSDYDWLGTAGSVAMYSIDYDKESEENKDEEDVSESKDLKELEDIIKSAINESGIETADLNPFSYGWGNKSNYSFMDIDEEEAWDGQPSAPSGVRASYNKRYSKALEALEAAGEDTTVITKGSEFVFPIKGDCFNTGYDVATMGRDSKPEISTARQEYKKNASASRTELVHSDVGIQNNDWSSRHKGIDIFCINGKTPLQACVTGIVTKIGKSSGKGGNTITITRGPPENAENFYYAHLDSHASGFGSKLDVGKKVEAGTVIGYCGKTGSAKNTFPHLHFSYYVGGNYNNSNRDPWHYLEPALKNIGSKRVGSSRKTSSYEEITSTEVESALTACNPSE